jgi:hypothetical protein
MLSPTSTESVWLQLPGSSRGAEMQLQVLVLVRAGSVKQVISPARSISLALRASWQQGPCGTRATPCVSAYVARMQEGHSSVAPAGVGCGLHASQDTLL